MADDLDISLTKIAPHKIEEELVELWQKADSVQKTRASLFTLVVFSSDVSREKYFHEIICTIIKKFPCRILFISSNDQCNKVSTEISLISPKNLSFACDYIHISLPKDQLHIFSYMITPHIISDLPAYLLWGENPNKNFQMLSSVKSLFQRIIFDSESSDNLFEFARTILPIYEKDHIEVGDLNWARTEKWKNLLGMIFMKNTEDLNDIHTMHIHYNAHHTKYFCHTKIQALYIQSWWATRLGWVLQDIQADGNKIHVHYKKNGSLILVSLIENKYPSLMSGSLQSIEINNQKEKKFYFHRNEEAPHQVKIDIGTSKHCETPYYYTFEKGQRGNSLVKEIYHKKVSAHFIEVLQVLSSITQGSLC